jgi:hypothetical protein
MVVVYVSKDLRLRIVAARPLGQNTKFAVRIAGHMTNKHSSLVRLLEPQLTAEAVAELLDSLHVLPSLLMDEGATVSRATLAFALNLLLFKDLLERVPTGRQYVREANRQGRKVVFDHGALRTVALAGMGELPAGELAITRVLLPLGYQQRGLYPLDRLGMTGRSYAHLDLPEDLPQFFVSELHPERFSDGFQAAVARVTSTSRDPLSREDLRDLQSLAASGRLPFQKAIQLLPAMFACFNRQHTAPALRDYEILLSESKEMAWIATEGNAFNHATDRVNDLDALVAAQKALGRPLKDTIETSRTGRVKQTAFKADLVRREFVHDAGIVERVVPGSFYEFIQRDHFEDPSSGARKLDLAFDASNAQGIFKMTAAA